MSRLAYTRVDMVRGQEHVTRFETVEEAVETPPEDGRSLVLDGSTAIARGSSTVWLVCPDADEYEEEAIKECDS